MIKGGPIIIIEDDADDQELMEEVLRSLHVPNKLRFFKNCTDAYNYLSTTDDHPFLIFSDINLPKMSGSELKRKINLDENIRRKCIPFVFLTTTSSNKAIAEGYDIYAQGFFTKPQDINSLRNMVEVIINYWKLARHANFDLLKK